MQINHLFLSIDADVFATSSEWWAKSIGQSWDREPILSCHAWDVTEDRLLQVLDNNQGNGSTAMTLHVPELDTRTERMGRAGIKVRKRVKVTGFDTMRCAKFADREGNTVGLLDGS